MGDITLEFSNVHTLKKDPATMKLPKSIKRLKKWIRANPGSINWHVAREEMKKKQKRFNEKVLRESQLNLFEECKA